MAKMNVNEQLDRMNYLMNYSAKPITEHKSSIEYHTVGADGKVYGIIKEGNVYYIKEGQVGKEQLSESYEYIGGYNYRNENGYKSYNEATKQLELKLISLNENYCKHNDVSTVDFKRNEKSMKTLTEAARKEIDRMHQIFENCQCIGKPNMQDPESKGKATDPKKQGAPFEEPVKAELDKDMNKTAKVKDANVGPEVKGVDAELESDKMKTKKVEPAEQPKDAHDDLDGEGLADKKGKMNKGVVNEEMDNFRGDENMWGDAELEPIEAARMQYGEHPEFDDDDLVGFGDEEEVEGEQPVSEIELDNQVEPEVGAEDALGEDEPEEEIDECDGFDCLIKEVEDAMGVSDESEEQLDEEELISGDKKELTGENPKNGASDCVLTGKCPKKGRPEVKQGMMIKPVVLAEQIDKIVNEVCDEMCCGCGKKKAKKHETLREAIDRIVKEEMQEFGKHPRYGKEPFTTPANKSKFVAQGDYEMDDESAKQSVQYGKKIGKGDPFEQVVNRVTELVKESLSKKA